jgi:hypothetical protein
MKQLKLTPDATFARLYSDSAVEPSEYDAHAEQLKHAHANPALHRPTNEGCVPFTAHVIVGGGVGDSVGEGVGLLLGNCEGDTVGLKLGS